MHPTRRRRTTPFALVVALAVPACASEPEPATRSASVVARPASFVNGDVCPEAEDPALPPRAGCVTSVTSGDDTMSVYALVRRDGRPRSWRIRLSTSEGDADRRLPYGTVSAYPRVAAASDVDGDGDADWWWVKVLDYASHGAVWGGLNVFAGEAGSLGPVELDGEPLVVDYGGISRLGEGARCGDGEITAIRVEAENRVNTRWATIERVYAIDGTTARLVDRREGILEIEGYSDPDLHRYYRVDCFGAEFTPVGEVAAP